MPRIPKKDLPTSEARWWGLGLPLLVRWQAEGVDVGDRQAVARHILAGATKAKKAIAKAQAMVMVPTAGKPSHAELADPDPRQILAYYREKLNEAIARESPDLGELKDLNKLWLDTSAAVRLQEANIRAEALARHKMGQAEGETVGRGEVCLWLRALIHGMLRGADVQANRLALLCDRVDIVADIHEELLARHVTQPLATSIEAGEYDLPKWLQEEITNEINLWTSHKS